MALRWKRIIALLLAGLMLFCLSSCSSRTLEVTDASKVVSIVDKGINYSIYVHEDTGVWYLFVQGYRKGGLTVMVNADGTPYTRG